MYFILSYDSEGTDLEKNELKEFIKAEIATLKWAKPLNNLFIVECKSVRIRRIILRNFFTYADNNPTQRIRFILTPLINAGDLGGRIPNRLWEHIRSITVNRDENDLY